MVQFRAMPPPVQNGTSRDVNGTKDIALPHSVEAEQGVLGSMLIAPNDAIPHCIRRITDEHFYIPAHQTVFRALIEEWNAARGIDLITFTQTLRDQKLLETIGGAPALTHLCSFVPTAANVEYYIDIVCERKRRRDTIAHAEHAKVRAYDETADYSTIALRWRTSSSSSLHSVLLQVSSISSK